MRVRVKEVEQAEGRARVVFECDCGSGIGFWIGDPPSEAADVHVELEIEDEVSVGRDLILCNESRGVRRVGEDMILVGDALDIDAGGLFRLDFGCGSVALEFVGSPPVARGRYRILSRRVKAYNCNY